MLRYEREALSWKHPHHAVQGRGRGIKTHKQVGLHAWRDPSQLHEHPTRCRGRHLNCKDAPVNASHVKNDNVGTWIPHRVCNKQSPGRLGLGNRGQQVWEPSCTRWITLGLNELHKALYTQGQAGSHNKLLRLKVRDHDCKTQLKMSPLGRFNLSGRRSYRQVVNVC